MDEPLFRETRMFEPELPWECNGARLTNRRAFAQHILPRSPCIQGSTSGNWNRRFYGHPVKVSGVMSTNRRRTIRLRAIVRQKIFWHIARIGERGAQVLPSSKSKKIRIKGGTAWLANQTYW
jgi:hypothetical protein